MPERNSIEEERCVCPTDPEAVVLDWLHCFRPEAGRQGREDRTRRGRDAPRGDPSAGSQNKENGDKILP